jgi:hypothetical protein
MSGLEIFVLSFCVAFIVASDRFKALVASVRRLVR